MADKFLQFQEHIKDDNSIYHSEIINLIHAFIRLQIMYMDEKFISVIKQRGRDVETEFVFQRQFQLNFFIVKLNALLYDDTNNKSFIFEKLKNIEDTNESIKKGKEFLREGLVLIAAGKTPVRNLRNRVIAHLGDDYPKENERKIAFYANEKIKAGFHDMMEGLFKVYLGVNLIIARRWSNQKEYLELAEKRIRKATYQMFNIPEEILNEDDTRL